MCEYCDTNDIDTEKVFGALDNYKKMGVDEVVPLETVYASMLAIYNDGQMALLAVRRIRNSNAANAQQCIGVTVRNVVSELELMVACRGHRGHILDG